MAQLSPSHLYKGNLISLSLSIGEDEQDTMYTPYSPDLANPDVVNPLKQAETFEASRTFRVGFGGGARVTVTGSRSFIRGSLGQIRTGIKAVLRTVFEGGSRNIKKYMRGASKEAIDTATKNPDKAVDALAGEVANYAARTRGKALKRSGRQFIDNLPSTKPTGSVDIGGITYRADDLAPFYKQDGKKRAVTLADEFEIGKGDKWLVRDTSDGNAMTAFLQRMQKAPADDVLSGNPIKKSVDDLLVDGGKLSDEGLEEATQQIARGKGASGEFKSYGEGYEASLKGVKPKNVLEDSVDDIATRAKKPVQTETSGIQTGFNRLVIGTFTVAVGAYILQGVTDSLLSALGINPNCREDAEKAYPNDPVKQDEYVEECLDRAARNVAYVGAAAVGIVGLIAFAVIGRVIPKRKSKVVYE